mgnify:CR=1 FL=1
MTLDQATVAYQAAKKMEQLYNAYRSTSLAHIWVLRQARRNIQERRNSSIEEQMRTTKDILIRENLAKETDLVFGIRVQQVRRRIKELQMFNLEV